MAEIRAQFTYSPEGILSIVPEFDENNRIADKQVEFLEELERDWVGEVKEDDGTIESIEFELARSFGSFEFPPENHEKLARYLALISALLPYYPEDDIDRVFALPWIGDRGVSGVVYQQFQRWIDCEEGIDEETARACIQAMAYPFGEEFTEQAKKEFRLWGDEGYHAEGSMFEYVVSQGTMSHFTITQSIETEDTVTYKRGEVEWKWVDFRTLGSCACWGVNGEERDRLYMDRRTLRLYEMLPHNIDFAHQAFSLMLGAGALAHKAATYEGTEDVFANVNWLSEETHQKAQ
jgi:hypothetical protein